MDNGLKELRNIRMMLETLNRKLDEYMDIGVIVPRAKRVRVKVRPVEPGVFTRNR